MAPRNTSSTGALIQALIDDLQLQSSTQIEERFALLEKRIENLEKILTTEVQSQASVKHCYLCENDVLARGLCSKHYQQWRYRQRKQSAKESSNAKDVAALYLSADPENLRIDN